MKFGNFVVNQNRYVVVLVICFPILVTLFIPIQSISVTAVLLITTLWLMQYLFWLWVIGSLLHRIVEGEKRTSITKFRVNMIIIVTYFVVIITMKVFEEDLYVPFSPFLLLAFSICCIYAIAYQIYFVAKMVHLAEHLYSIKDFQNLARTIVQLVIAPIGVLFVHKRVQELAKASQEITRKLE